MYESREMETAFATSLGRVLMKGSKTFLAQAEWQTTEHSRGVMLMLRKPCWESASRPSSSYSAESRETSRLCVWGRRTRRMGWRRVE